MDGHFDHVMLSRIQFAFTAMFHILWPVLSIGLSWLLVAMEAMWLKTKDPAYYKHLRFWMHIFLLNFAAGVVSGIPMEFQFGTNWGSFSRSGGDVFGHLLGFEAATAFMLESAFIGIMAFGWKRVSRPMHLFATCMVAFAASVSAFWIMSANGWMQTPTGGHFVNGIFLIASHIDSIFNPDAGWAFAHMWVAAIEITVFVVGGVSAWHLRRGTHVDFFLKSFKMAVVASIIATPLQIFLGDGSGKSVYEYQPAKLAAMEAHWETNAPGEGAPWHIIAWPDKSRRENVWQLDVPYALSLITTSSPTGTVRGLKEFPPEDLPPIWPTFYSFRVMMGVGFFLFGVMLWTVWAWKKGRLTVDRITSQRTLLKAWMTAFPLSYIAMEAGWITREVGRQPWIIYGFLRTNESATTLPATVVGGSLIAFIAFYAILFFVTVLFIRRIILAGPVHEAPDWTPRTR